MRILNQHTFLSATTTAGTSSKYLTDYRIGDKIERTLQGTLTSGATVQLYTHVNLTNENTRHLVSTFSTSSFSTVIDGPVAAVEIVKSGASGTAWVDGLV